MLIDVRFDYDPDSTDRYGDLQRQWLKEKLSQSNADVTLIAAGVQIIPDRWFITEAFEWESKSYIFDLINEFKKSGVILLSGDVHFAQFYDVKCSSLTGYDLFEVTTSGLTHHVNQFFKVGYEMLHFATPEFWRASDVFINYNFGLIQISRKDDDVIVDVQVKDIYDEIRLRKVLSIKQNLTFKESDTRYS